MASFTRNANPNEFMGGSSLDLFILGPSAHFGPDDFIIGRQGAATLLIQENIAQNLS